MEDVSRAAEDRLTRKEVCALYRIDASTLRRWEREGLEFRCGRIRESTLLWWSERREAAKRLGMPPRLFFLKPVAVQQKLMAAELEQRRAECMQA